MAKARSVILVPAMYVVLVMSAAAPSVWAQTGSLPIKYVSSETTAPMQQGWTYVGKCFSETFGCPGTHVPEPPQEPIDYHCYYQGWYDDNDDLIPQNNCSFTVGCLKSTEYYNSPPQNVIEGTCTHTEWIAFDNGVYLDPRFRPLTIEDSPSQASPPFGAPQFIRAPSYDTLRISTGDGNMVDGSLPINIDEFGNPIGPINNRNWGQAQIRRGFNLSPGTASVTLLCKVAAGPRPASHELVRVRVFNLRFTFGVDGDETSPTYGRLVYGDDASGNPKGFAFGETAVEVAEPDPEGSVNGEFFTLRVIMHDNGDFQAHLNEKIGSPFTGHIDFSDPGDNEVSLAPDEGDDTMWLDYIQLLEGEVPPSCPELVFDYDRSESVSEDDMANFFFYATGPVDATGTWASLPPDCKCMDVNQDQSLDMEDFAVLQRSPHIKWCTPVSLVNGNFEGGSTGGIATGWTSYTRPTTPSYIAYTLQTDSGSPDGGMYQQIQTQYVVSGGAGVYQVVSGCTIGHTYRIQGWFRTNSQLNCRATVKCDPYGGTSYSNAIDLSPAATTRGNLWVHFDSEVTAQASSITFFLDSQTLAYTAGSNGKAAAFDGLAITRCTIIP